MSIQIIDNVKKFLDDHPKVEKTLEASAWVLATGAVLGLGAAVVSGGWAGLEYIKDIANERVIGAGGVDLTNAHTAAVHAARAAAKVAPTLHFAKEALTTGAALMLGTYVTGGSVALISKIKSIRANAEEPSVDNVNGFKPKIG